MRQFMFLLLTMVVFGSCNQKSDLEITGVEVLSSTEIGLDQVEITDIKAEYQRLRNELLSKYKGKEYPKAYTRQLVASILNQYPHVKGLKDEARQVELKKLVGAALTKPTSAKSQSGNLMFRSGNDPWAFTYREQDCPFYPNTENCNSWFMYECFGHCEQTSEYMADEIILMEMGLESTYQEAVDGCNDLYPNQDPEYGPLAICLEAADMDYDDVWAIIDMEWVQWGNDWLHCDCSCLSTFGNNPCH